MAERKTAIAAATRVCALRRYRPPAQTEARAAGRRAKVAWIAGWWTIFVLAPALFAALRQADPLPALALALGGTVVIALGALRGR